jgi:hypothetical protein
MIPTRSPGSTPAAVSRVLIRPAAAPWGRGPRLVFVNGSLSRELSSPAPDGIRAMGLAEALESEPALVEAHLTRLAPHRHNACAAKQRSKAAAQAA